MVRFLRCYGVPNITVYDTASSLPLHVDLLGALEQVVHVTRVPTNAGPRSFLTPSTLAGLPRHFALTDADLRPHPDLPPNFLAYLAYLTQAFPGRKAGFALDLALRDQFIPGVHDPASGATIAQWEEAHFWGARLPTPPGGPPAVRELPATVSGPDFWRDAVAARQPAVLRGPPPDGAGWRAADRWTAEYLADVAVRRGGEG